LAVTSLDLMRDLLWEMSTHQAGQAGTKDVRGLSWRLADVAGHLDGMVMMEEDAASRAREEGGCVGEGAARRGRTAVRVGGGGGGKDFCRNNNGKRTARDEDER
jgi:hypothetical protein